ncbi:hypothetical protein B9Z19DRAFT_239338 [Tuber borchii]|uniref:Uncharacterized protein n=1 Tax=Tuber borchii TaxID=42251 RepID=A0A2T6ZME5_TUBBO|nr:hypothetical protein B9Z19DRAFT_239338 [Tuber borchii]
MLRNTIQTLFSSLFSTTTTTTNMARDPAADTIVPANAPIVVIITSGPCTHERITREFNKICKICKRRHFFNWAYHCGICGASACHNCRPRWAERTWVDFATVLERGWEVK